MNQHSFIGKEPKTKRGRRTREKLLEAAEIEFGEKGYHEAAISGITTRAGVALGTFYVHFHSKEEIYRALVAYLGDQTRHWIAERVGDTRDRLAAEQRGVEAFIEFVRRHPNVYRIVTEAQFVAEDAFRSYYTVFADAYREQLERAAADGQIRDGDFAVWSWALIGMSVFLGMRFAAWDDTQASSITAAAAADLLRDGMTRNDDDVDP